MKEGNCAAHGSLASWHPNVCEPLFPHPPTSRLGDKLDSFPQTCAPHPASHEHFYQTSGEEEQHLVSEFSDFLKLTSYIYDQFGDAKGTCEKHHDRPPWPGQENFVL